MLLFIRTTNARVCIIITSYSWLIHCFVVKKRENLYVNASIYMCTWLYEKEMIFFSLSLLKDSSFFPSSSVQSFVSDRLVNASPQLSYRLLTSIQPQRNLDPRFQKLLVRQHEQRKWKKRVSLEWRRYSMSSTDVSYFPRETSLPSSHTLSSLSFFFSLPTYKLDYMWVYAFQFYQHMNFMFFIYLCIYMPLIAFFDERNNRISIIYIVVVP